MNWLDSQVMKSFIQINSQGNDNIEYYCRMIQNQTDALLPNTRIDLEKQQNTCFRVGQNLIILSNMSLFEIRLGGQIDQGIEFVKRDPHTYILKREEVTETVAFKAIYGIVRLKYNVYIILVTDHTSVANINQNVVYEVKNLQAIAIGRNQQQPFLEHLLQSFKLLHLYYSPTYNLSQRLQYHYENATVYTHNYITNYAYSLCYRNYPNELLTVFITGYARSVVIQKGQEKHTISIVSRGSSKRMGRRWLRRGIDKEGNAAIDYQTEMVYEIKANGNHNIYSHVQQRGSVPVLWSQYPQLKLKAKICIIGSQAQNKQLGSIYLRKLQKCQKRVLLLNLIGKTGQERRLGEQYESVFNSSNLACTKLCWFDNNGQYSSKGQRCFIELIQQWKQQIDEIGYFALQSNGNQQLRPVRKQNGIVRTNCIDCLDRTNFIQSLFAKILCLKFQAHRNGGDDTIFDCPFQTLSTQQLEKSFKQLWRQNGNAISRQYSGTIAMRGDFLQNGRRTFKGLMTDFKTGLIRFYNGSFCDYYYQNCLDLHFKKINLHQEEQGFTGSRLKKLALTLALCSIGLIPVVTHAIIENEVKEEQKRVIWNVGANFIGMGVYYKVLQLLSRYILQKPLSRKQQAEYLKA